MLDKHGAFIDVGQDYSACDVAIMFGSWKGRDRSHHVARTSVARNSNVFVCIETPLLGRVMFEKNKHYRVGINGFLNNSGIFFNQQHKNDRLSQLGIQFPGWKDNSNGHVLIMLQLPGDASLRGINMYSWARYCVEQIKKHAPDREIVIRSHPGHRIKDTDEFYKFVADLLIDNNNIKISPGNEKPLKDDLENCYCTVSYSSGSGIDSILHGVPTIATDPGNFAWGISSNYVEDINNLTRADSKQIEDWLCNLAYSQWTIEEMHNGTVWTHLFPIIQQLYAEEIAKQEKKKKK
jgi:hypothetical protein